MEQAGLIADPVAVTLQEGQTNRDVRIEFVPGGVIEVAVTDESTQAPVGNANVSVQTASREHRWAMTNPEGVARMVVRPGDYVVQGVWHRDYRRACPIGSPRRRRASGSARSRWGRSLRSDWTRG
jgi:hypothetical protein